LQQTQRLIRHCDLKPTADRAGGDASRPFLWLTHGATTGPMVREALKLVHWDAFLGGRADTTHQPLSGKNTVMTFS
jgi:hypothetical protein